MPKGFSAKEKELITDTLIDRGRELFCSYGLKKTSIRELAEAAGISVGSFYSFFPSKEELYFEILEREEAQLKEALLARLTGKPLDSEGFYRFLKDAFNLLQSNSLLLRTVTEDDYQELLRKLPEEALSRHQANDTMTLAPLIQHWQGQGIMLNEDPEVISGLLRAIFLISLHQKEIGPEIFPKTIDLLLRLVANGLIREE